MTVQANDRILIVDDEPDIALILKLHLEDAGYSTAWAQDGKKALAMLAEGEYSLVLLDIRLPRLGGVEVLRCVRESGNNVAVIMMTAHGSEDLAVECMKAGAIDYFPKPFALDDMLPRVQRAIAYRRALLEKQRLEQEKANFVSMLSHDLKNPITAVIGSIDIMREGRLGPVNSEQVEYLESAIDSCNEVVAMIDNLLDIHRFEAGKMQMNISIYNPVDIITTVARRFSKAAAHEQIRFVVEIAKELPPVAVDRSALTRVIANLLGNAIKFTPQEGEIILSCQRVRQKELPEKLKLPEYLNIPEEFFRHRQYVNLNITDNGAGIADEDLARVFERFYQSKRAGNERGGAGLGLAYCKMAIEKMGGEIWVESELGKGSIFRIVLPCKEDI
ncbi:MAG TPA: response regulator [Desulfuromonadaceae bacterium]